VRRWTLLVVSHDSEAPQSYPVTERVLRAAGVGAVAVLLIAMVGVGTIIARLGRLGGPPAPTMAAAEPVPSHPGVLRLEGRVDTLRAVVDSITALDDSLVRATASTDTLLDRARTVNARLLSLDSVARRSAPRRTAP
jgi:hypothetical protein